MGRVKDNEDIERFYKTIIHDMLYLSTSRASYEFFTECHKIISSYNKKKLS